MNDFRLCIKRENIKPYYAHIIKKEIYTIEELSYFIYENIHLIDEDILDESFIKFVYETINEDISNLSFSDAIEVILRSNNLYSYDDIELIRNILTNYKEGDYLTRAKMIGDKCLINKEYFLALKHYNNILQRSEISNINQIFIDDVLFNKAITLARMLNFKDAYNIFEKIYKRSSSDENKFYYFMCMKMYDEAKYEKYKSDDEMFEKIDEAVNGIGNNKIVYNVALRYSFMIDDVIEEWKHQVSEDYIEK